MMDDLLDDSPFPTPKKRGRPKGVKNSPRPDAAATLTNADVRSLLEGVGITRLQQLFRMSRGKVEKALIGCPILTTSKNGDPRYDLPVAAAYLVKPVSDLKTALKDLKPDDLPEHLRETYWNAIIKQQKARQLMGELWDTNDIMTVLGDVFKTIRSHTMLWADIVEEKGGLNAKQHSILMGLVDTLLDEIHGSLVSSEKKSVTPSVVASLSDADDDL